MTTGLKIPFRQPDYRFAAIVAVIFATTLIPRFFFHEFWRDELQSWMLATDQANLTTVLARVRYEGHPSLWYVSLWFVSRLRHDPISMQILHGLTATATVFLMAAFAPALRWQRVLLCASYFVLFEYAVISRNYASGMLALIAFAALVSRRPTAYVSAALLLVVAINSNAFAAMMTLMICLWVALRWQVDGRPFPRRFVAGVTIVAAGFLLAFLQMRAPADRNWSPTLFDLDPMRAGKMAAAVWRSFVPIPSPGRAWWATNFLDFEPITNKLNIIQGVLGIAMFFLATWLLPNRRQVRLLWVLGASMLVVFGYVKYTGSLRHHGHFFVLFLVAWWLGSARDAVETSAEADSRRTWIFNAILTAQAIAGVTTSIADTLMPFSSSREVAQYLRMHYQNFALMGQVDYSTAPVAAHLHQPMYFPGPARWGTFMKWDAARAMWIAPEKLPQAGRHLRQEDPARAVLLLVSDDSTLKVDESVFRRVARFDNATVKSERYTLFEFVGP
jgi:hypothetical protein